MDNFRVKILQSLLQLLTLLLMSVTVSAQSSTEMKNIFEKAESYYLYEDYELANQLYLLIDTTGNGNITI